ncbi:MAG: GntR family transcriptional regulator [Succinivibrio sp.]|nr:GntR family transcriptional regulator [Succinivibrio sp.]
MENKSDFAFKYIREKIISGEYAPLTALSESALQEELKTSRTPIREAVLRLRDLGFIYIYSSKATVVSELSLDLINEMYSTRFLCEPYAYASAVSHLNKTEIEQFKHSFENIPSSLNANERRMYLIGLDDTLHETLLKGCTNRFILKTLSMVYYHNRRLRRFVKEQISISEHVNLIDAVLKENEDLIKQKTLEHLEHSRVTTLQAYQRGELSKLTTQKE